jgi:hypothetical protein
MSKKIFKGFKQVTADQFREAQESNLLNGYIWFVRKEVSDGETNDTANDEYSIYFGSRKYGHFCEGEISGIKAQIETLNGNVEDILDVLKGLTEAVEANKTKIEANEGEIAKNKQSLLNLQGTLETFLVKDVNANDKVLNVADGILSTAINLVYNNNRISLVGKNNEEIAGFDASEFVKDSVLEDVKVETKEDGEKYIVFTWKTEGEETKTDEIKVSDFAKLYEAGTGLELAADGVTFNVKIAENGNFLSVNDNNELIVDDMTVDKTKIKEAITIEGGPLASDAVKAAFEGGVIPAGADIQSVLKALLCVEIYPQPSKNSPDFSVSITAPTISVPTGSSLVKVSNDYLAEIGQSLAFSAVTAKAVSVSKTNPKVSGFTHGYSSELTGDNIVDSTEVSSEWTVTQMTGNVYELSATSSGFTGTLPTTVQNAVASSCKLAACNLTVSLGTNKYTVTEDAPKHSGTHTGVATYYVVSNLGGRKTDEVSPEIKAQTTAVEKDPDNKSATFTVNGVYPVFNNMVSTTASNTATVNNKMALSTGKVFEISYGPETDAFHAFAYPATHTLSKVEIYNTMSKAYEDYTGGSSTTDVTYAIQNVNTAYKLWKRAGNAYSETTKFRFTLNKNLNTK